MANFSSYDEATDRLEIDSSVVAKSEMSDVLLYFSNIEDPITRADILNQMKLASTIF